MRLQLLLFILLLSSFDLLAQTWCKKTDFPGSSRRNTNGFSLNGKGYVCLGGDNTSSTSGHFKDLEMYDPDTDTWTSKANFPGIARRNGIAFTIDSFAFVGLGWNNRSNFDDIYRYNANSDIWDTITAYPGLGTRTPIAASVKGKGYVGGGSRSTSSSREKDFYEYDPLNDSWTQLSDFPFGDRGAGISFSSDSLVYFGLGFGNGSYHDDLWSYNPRTNVWTQLSSFPGSNRFEASCFKLENNIVIVGGGSGGSTNSTYSDYYKYDIANDTWTSIVGFSAGTRSRGAYFSIGNKGYISTGSNGSDLKDTWEFAPKNYTFLNSDSTFCIGDSILFDASTANAVYLWQDSSTNASFFASDSGIYWVEIDANGCIRRDSIEINYKPEIKLDLGNDTLLCFGDTLSLDVTLLGASYLWNDSTRNPTFKIDTAGVYWVEVSQNNCLKRDSIEVSFAPLPPKPFINQVGNNLSISENGFYQWYKDSNSIPNETDSLLTVTSSGLYHCSLTDSIGCTINSDTLSVIITGIKENNILDVVIYPNPTNGILNIQFEKSRIIQSLEVYSLDGKQIYLDNNLGNNQSFQVNLSHINKGLYLLKLRFNDSNATMKLLIE